MRSKLTTFFNVNKLQWKGLKNPCFQPIAAILNNYKKILLLALPLYLLSVALIFKLIKPSYAVEALLNIEPKLPRLLYQTDPSKYLHSYEDWLRTQVSIITSYPLIEKAIKDYETKGLKWQLPEESLKASMDRLVANIKVTNRRETQIIAISMESKRKKGMEELVNAIVRSYVNYERNNQKETDTFKLNYLSGKKEKTESEIENKALELENLSRKYGTAVTEEKNLYVYIEELSDLRKAFNKILVQRIQQENKLIEYKRKENVLKKMDIKGFVDDNLKSHPVLVENYKNLTGIEYELQAKTSGLSKANQERVYLESKLKDLKGLSDKVIQKLQTEQYQIVRNKLVADNTKEIIDIKTEIAYLKRSEAQLEVEIERVRKKLLDYNTIVMRAANRKTEIDRLRQRLGLIFGRIDEVEVELAIPKRITIVSWALKPEPNHGSKRKLALIAMVLVSLLLPSAIFVSLDFLDPSLRKPYDIQKILGFAATGYLIDHEDDPQIVQIPSQQIYKERPTSFTSNQFKEISIKIYKEHNENKTQVFAICSSESQSGTTTMASNLLAQLDGTPEEKIYLDMNYTSPFGKNTPKPTFQIMTGTPEVVRKQASQSIQELENLLNELKQKYKYIFLDCPPLLSFSETTRFATLAQAVIFVASAHKTNWDDLKKGVDQLDALGVSVLSVLMNQVCANQVTGLANSIDTYYKNLGDHWHG
ncbi:MAG: hypothetical protein AAF518_11955 [Spirochaetota bacterium]